MLIKALFDQRWWLKTSIWKVNWKKELNDKRVELLNWE